MLSAARISEAIRMKRKKMKQDGVENMIDTAPGPQMNPQDVFNLKQKAQLEETMDLPMKNEASSDPADADIDGSSQDVMMLKKQMARMQRVFDQMKMSDR